ncbi:MAG: hypothetical protein ACTSSN_02145 [Candidatus Heimdallarchaeaceae archaeon]
MRILFRCYNCETINEIPDNYKHRFCNNCNKIITYTSGEAIICNKSSHDYDAFLKVGNLNTDLAEKFFSIADSHIELISNLIESYVQKQVELPDIPSASISDTILHLVKGNVSGTLDDLIRSCDLFNIGLNKLEKILLQMIKEGLVYLPKSWLLNLT